MSADPAVIGAVPAHWLWMLLGAVMYPLWLAAGVADVLVHWRDRIERHAGVRESLMHVAMCIQMGIPVLMLLFLEFTAPVFLVATAAVVLHGWTSWRDSRFADSVRHIGPLEQKIHVALDAVPWIGLALVALLHAPTLRGLVMPGAGADWSWRWRDPPLSPGLLTVMLTSSLLLGLLPSVLELLRAWRQTRDL